MRKYEQLLSLADKNNLIVREKDLLYYDGLIIDEKITIRQTIDTSQEKAGVLAEEIGHAATSVGNILDYTNPNNWKQEVKARTYGYGLMIGLDGIVDACKAGCQDEYEAADRLECTVQYLREAVSRFREIYGIKTEYKGYIIFFEPNLRIQRKELI